MTKDDADDLCGGCLAERFTIAVGDGDLFHHFEHVLDLCAFVAGGLVAANARLRLLCHCCCSLFAVCYWGNAARLVPLKHTMGRLSTIYHVKAVEIHLLHLTCSRYERYSP